MPSADTRSITIPVPGSWWTIRSLAPHPGDQPADSAEIFIYGDIGENWDGETIAAREFVAALDGVNADYLTVRINSFGGSVTDGLAIYNALKRKGQRSAIAVEIDGIAASIASLIAMAGDTVTMAENSLLMIHAPWGVSIGNAGDMREMAATLDRHAEAMASAYVRPEFSRDQALALLTDGVDHWYTADEAKAAGLIDQIGAAAPAQASIPERYRVGALALPDRPPATADPAQDGRPRPTNATPSPAAPPVRAVFASLSAPTGASPQELVMSDPSMPSAPNVAEITAHAQASARAALAQRNTDLKARFDAFCKASPAGQSDLIRGCYDAAMADLDQSADGFTQAVLAKLAEAQAEQPGPVAGAHTTRASILEDERDKLKSACTSALLARAAIAAPEAKMDLNGNPFRGKSLARIAEDSLVRGGTRVDGLDPMRIVALAFTQSTSDFPVLMENVMHKALLAGYNVAADTWRRWCAVGSVSDFRAHNRYMLGSIGDLTPVSEGGEFQNASIPDGRKQSVTIGTRGQILTLTRQAIINDDLGAFVGLAEARGRAAARTVENAVYTAMGLNSGYGPTLSDGKTIIHSDHGNIASTGGAPSVATVESGILTMAAQKDISGNDYLDLRPSILLLPIGLDMTGRVLNTSANDPAATGSSKNFLTPNPYQGYFADIVSSQRLVATKWYMLASPSVAPVLEVSFLNGVQEPVMEMETGFTVDGVSWKTRLDFGVSGVGYEGIVYNAGQ